MKQFVIKHDSSFFAISLGSIQSITEQKALQFRQNITDYSNMSYRDTITLIQSVITLTNTAESYQLEKKYEEASHEYEKAACLLEQNEDYNNAADYYAFAAIMKEHSEKWRGISYLWYKASGKQTGMKNYQDFNGLEHSYPTISFEKWLSYSAKEKKAHALQYAAYSEDNGPNDSYWLFNQAVEAYKQANNKDRMIECMISSTNRYVTQYHEVPVEIINCWESIIKSGLSTEQKKLLVLGFNEIYNNMNRNGTPNARYFYIQTRKLQTSLAFYRKKRLKGIVGTLSYWFSSYGTSLIKILSRVVVMVLVVFPLLFWATDHSLKLGSIPQSINVFLGAANLESYTSCAYWIGIVERIYSYVVLAVIGTYLINRIVKQID